MHCSHTLIKCFDLSVYPTGFVMLIRLYCILIHFVILWSQAAARFFPIFDQVRSWNVISSLCKSKTCSMLYAKPSFHPGRTSDTSYHDQDYILTRDIIPDLLSYWRDELTLPHQKDPPTVSGCHSHTIGLVSECWVSLSMICK